MHQRQMQPLGAKPGCLACSPSQYAARSILHYACRAKGSPVSACDTHISERNSVLERQSRYLSTPQNQRRTNTTITTGQTQPAARPLSPNHGWIIQRHQEYRTNGTLSHTLTNAGWTTPVEPEVKKPMLQERTAPLLVRRLWILNA